MRRVIFIVSVSLDGFMEGPNGELDWLVEEDGAFDTGDFFERFDTMFFGRKAYERMVVPQLSVSIMNAADRELFLMLHSIRKYVFSRGQKHVRGNGMVVNDNLKEEVDRIRDEDGKNILFCGGADIYSTFAELDLIDEYVLTVHPVLLVSGKSLFRHNAPPLNMELVGRRDLKSGVVILHYSRQENYMP